MIPVLPAILVVDDDDLLRRAIAKMVQRLGAVALESASLASALDLMGAQHVDAVVCDLDLGDGSGLVIARQLRARGSDAPVIVVSGHPPSVVQAQMRPGDGVVDVLEKPFAGDTLATAIKRALRRL